MTYLVTLHDDFDFEKEYGQYHQELLNALNNEGEPINVIVDMLKPSMSFNDLLVATRDGRKKNRKNPFQHQNAKGVILVTGSNLMKASIDGFVKFGIVKNIRAFDSVDAALQKLAEASTRRA